LALDLYGEMAFPQKNLILRLPPTLQLAGKEQLISSSYFAPASRDVARIEEW
jgi:hypothetical protein